MKGDTRVIDRLNEILTYELTAINQYWLHARMCENWGYERLWKKIRAESLGEMKHADKVVERVLFLGGLPNLQRLGKVQVGQDVVEMLRLDLDVERNAVGLLNDGIELARTVADNGTRELLEGILKETEDHVSWLEAQLALVDQIKPENYLAQQVRD